MKGGMGVALMQQPENVCDILKTLRRNLPRDKSVSCKIRILQKTEDTIQFCKMVESCGIDGLAVHGRTRDQREGDKANWSDIALIKSELAIPVVLNGDVFEHGDFERARNETKVDGVMSARGALANPSIFSSTPVCIPEVVKQYVEKAIRYENNFQNTKYVVLRMYAGKLSFFSFFDYP